MSSRSKLCIILIKAMFVAGSLLVTTPAFSLQQSLTTPSGEDITFELYRTPNKNTALRILWIAPNFGIDPRHQQAAESLAKQGAEVWLIDLADALFLTRGANSMRAIPGQLVADLINAISQYNGQRTEVLVVSNSYGAIPALRGIRAWQAQNPKQPTLLGAVLFSPSFFNRVPQLGKSPDFIAELTATNAPIYIFQAENNGNRWHLPAVLTQLENATVYVEILKNVVSVFYQKDATASSKQHFENAPGMILRATKRLRRHPIPLTPLPLTQNNIQASNTIRGSGLDTQLKPYVGDVIPAPIQLHDADGRLFNIQNFRGKVTLINFWASWCPPCVEEIPSLNRLKQAMKDKPFQLISINYAETPEKIRGFLKKVDVDFPVLIDPGGKLAGQWKVLAFPSTFVIDPDGNIQFGVNAGIHWDTDDVIRRLNDLLPEPSIQK